MGRPPLVLTDEERVERRRAQYRSSKKTARSCHSEQRRKILAMQMKHYRDLHPDYVKKEKERKVETRRKSIIKVRTTHLRKLGKLWKKKLCKRFFRD
jgi:hypothetical protein